MSSPSPDLQNQVQVPPDLQRKIAEAQFAVEEAHDPSTEVVEFVEADPEQLALAAATTQRYSSVLRQVRVQVGGFDTPGTQLPIGFDRAEQLRRDARYN
jgi:hypothetical protein